MLRTHTAFHTPETHYRSRASKIVTLWNLTNSDLMEFNYHQCMMEISLYKLYLDTFSLSVSERSEKTLRF